MKDDIKLADLIGKNLSTNDIDELLVNGRIKFVEKPTTDPSAVSNSEEVDSDEQIRDNKLADLINNVKENEELVKTLEDMRDDLLKDMKIPPVSNKIADAAKKINGNNDPIITKKTFDDAEAIIDVYFPYVHTGFVPQLTPLLGDTIVVNNFKNCNSITKAAFDGLQFAEDGTAPEDVAEAASKRTVAETKANIEEDFADSMKAMAEYLINKLFWNIIWCRMWTSIFTMIEKLIAVPIDTPIIIIKGLLFKIPKLSKVNYYKYGLVHRALNKFKMVILCALPHKAWPDYEPEVTIKIYYNGELRTLLGLCNDNFIDMFKKCSNKKTNIDKKYRDKSNEEYDSMPDDSNTEIEDNNDYNKTITAEFNDMADSKPENIDECDLLNMFSESQEHNNGRYVGITPECVDAAKTVLQAAYDDAMYNNNSIDKKD